jgi:ABC-2 type transport system ATP-binding protein
MSCLIKAINLSKNFGAKRALDQVNFEIHQGAPIALVGPNGAGKTTLFSILCGYMQASAGSVEIFGQKPGSSHTFGRLAALPQDAQLDPGFSIAHQLSFYAQLQGYTKKESLFEAQRSIELVGLQDVLYEKPTILSHGMRKRVTIAQALIGAPEIVMLDEATAGLDPLHAREIRDLVATLSDQVTFILSSHDLSELERLCQQVLYLDQGRLKQHQSSGDEQGQRFYTLRMERQEQGLIQAISSLTQVAEVSMRQEKEYQICVNAGTELAIDIEILALCHQNNWRYRQLVNGKTLENQLF